MDKFCKYCGKEKAVEWSGLYSPKTGKKEMVLKCQTKPCCGGNHDERMTGNWFGPNWKCARCGYEGYWGY